jgi:peptidoglycan/LPS O-acetylase OafA/YrhL
LAPYEQGSCRSSVFLRFAARRWPPSDSLSQNAYAIYLVHYAFVIWLQYLLLGLALVAVAKGAIVFAGTLLLSWGAAAMLSRIPLGARLIGGQRASFRSVERPEQLWQTAGAASRSQPTRGGP